jgi:hypothetical protein
MALYWLNDKMDIDHVIRITPDGTVADAPGEYAPEVIVLLDEDGQITNDAEAELIRSVEAQGWELMTGYTGQFSYHGPIMHPSEYIGGRLALDIRERPGLYVAVEVSGLVDVPEGHEDTTDLAKLREMENDPIGWVVARKLDPAS